jgi:gamma-glutamyl phosphate reductase
MNVQKPDREAVESILRFVQTIDLCSPVGHAEMLMRMQDLNDEARTYLIEILIRAHPELQSHASNK